VLLGLLLIHWANNSGKSVKERLSTLQLRDIRRIPPPDIVVLGFVGIVFATLLSSALSPLPKISLLGKSNEFTGFSSYDVTSLFIVFLATKTFFKSSKVLNNLLVAIAISGTIAAVYGLSQHFGWDPIGGRQGSSRIPATFGNSLNFGGFLVMTIPATIAISLINRQKIDRRVFALVSIAVGLQLATAWLTGGRGAFLGIASGLIVLGVLISFSPGRKLQRQNLLLLAFSALVATFLVLIPVSDSGFGLQRISSIGDELAALTDTDITVGPGEGGLKARLGIWETALRLVASPVVPQSESNLKTSLRRIYGLGPEMFIYSYPLATNPKQNVELQSNAHNISLHIVATLGLLGLSALLVTFYGLVLLAKTTVIRSTKTTEVSDLPPKHVPLAMLVRRPA
jgi:Co/Zn/Cd efflux system component